MIKWTLDNCIIEASKYTYRSEFIKGSPSCYSKCVTKKWLSLVCSHMIPKIIGLMKCIVI